MLCNRAHTDDTFTPKKITKTYFAMKKTTPDSTQLNGILILYAMILMIFISTFASAKNSMTRIKLKHVSSNCSFTGNEPKKKSAEWQPLYSTDQITIRYRYSECKLANGSNNENVYLQVVNKTNEPLNIKWNTEYWYNGKCNGCESGNLENQQSIHLKPMETTEGTCSEKNSNSLRILSKMLGAGSKSELTDFNLKDIEIAIDK
jgi:uncharacterized protein YcfL